MSPERGIGWNSTNDNEVETSGQVRLEEVAEGRTRIDVTMNYTDPPGGKVEESGGRYLEPRAPDA